MSPHCTNPALPSPVLTPNLQPSVTQPRHSTPRTSTQPTIWQFIQSRLQSMPPANSNTDEHNAAPTSDYHHQATNNDNEPQNTEPTISPTTQSQSSLDQMTEASASNTRELHLTPPHRAQEVEQHTQDDMRQTTQQLPLQHDKRNDGWGDIHQYKNPQNHFRVLSKK